MPDGSDDYLCQPFQILHTATKLQFYEFFQFLM